LVNIYKKRVKLLPHVIWGSFGLPSVKKNLEILPCKMKILPLQHFHPTTTPNNCCGHRKNRFGWLPEWFSWRGKPRGCLILSERFFHKRQRHN